MILSTIWKTICLVTRLQKGVYYIFLPSHFPKEIVLFIISPLKSKQQRESKFITSTADSGLWVSPDALS